LSVAQPRHLLHTCEFDHSVSNQQQWDAALLDATDIARIMLTLKVDFVVVFLTLKSESMIAA